MPRAPRPTPSFVFHDLPQAEQALDAAARAGRPILLLTPPGGARYAGEGFYRAVLQAAEDRHPDARATAILDCGDDGALALAALAAGWKAIILGGSEKVGRKVTSVAERYEAHLHRRRPKALDLGQSDDPGGLVARTLNSC